MTNEILYGLWLGFYILCAGLGFIPEPAGAGKALLVLASIVFFVPGALLLHRGQKKQVRLICAVSLGVTLVMLVLNVLSAAASEAAGLVLYWMLILLSAPMVCGQYWILSLFLWACLLVASFSKKKG